MQTISRVRLAPFPPPLCLGLLILAGPLLLLPNPVWGIGIALILPVIVQFFVAGAEPGRRRLHTADSAVLGLLAAGVVGTAVGLYVVPNAQVSQPKLLGLIDAVGVYFGVRQYARSADRAVTAAVILSAIGLGIALVGFVGTAWLIDYSKTTLLTRLYERLPHLIRAVPSSHGTIPGFHPNEVAGTLVLLIPVVVSTLLLILRQPRLEARRFDRFRAAVVTVLALASLAGMLAYLGLSFSRTAWVSLGLTLLGMAILRAPRSVFTWLTIALVLLAGFWLGTGPLGDRVLSATDLTADPVTWGRPTRPEIWSRALQMIEAHPVTGIGLNTFPYVVRAQYPFAYHNEQFVPHAHNLLLQVALDYGVIGLGCFLVLVVFAFRGVGRALRGGPVARDLAVGLGGALIAYLAFGLVDAIAVGAKPTFLPWAVMALAVGLGDAEHSG